MWRRNRAWTTTWAAKIMEPPVEEEPGEPPNEDRLKWPDSHCLSGHVSGTNYENTVTLWRLGEGKP